jgi:protein-tyrosine phosphatase
MPGRAPGPARGPVKGFVDIHSHILWGLDDGPRDFETSVEMLRIAAANGTADIVATPHSDLQFSFQPEEMAARIEQLSQAAASPRIHTGCDFHLHFDNIEDCLANPRKYTINHRRYLMVEFSDMNIPRTASQIFERMFQADITPVITHPERNALLMRAIPQLVAWIHAGCLLQVTAQSFLGRFGKAAQNGVEELMAREMVHFAASDGHDPVQRPPDLLPAYELVTRRYGPETAERLFITNPAATLTGEYLEVSLPQDDHARKKWFQFW